MLAIFWLSAAWGRAGAQDLSLFVADQRIACAETVDVPVQASRFRAMLTMQGGIGWDTSRLRFDTLIGRGPSALGLTPGNFGFTWVGSGLLYFSWDDPLLRGVTLPDSSVLFVARFRVLTRDPLDLFIRVGSDSVPMEFIDTARRRLSVGHRDGRLRLLFEIPAFDPFPDTTRICGTSGSLDAGGGFASYVWDSLNRARTLAVLRDSLYRVTVLNALRCRGSDSTLLRLLPIPDGTLSLTGDTLLCEGSMRLLRATGGIRYRWYRNDTLLASPTGDTLQARMGGRYRVELVNPEGCRRLLPSGITLTHIPRPRLAFDLRGVCSEVPVTFVNRSVVPTVGQVDWQWRFGDGATDTRDSVEHVYRDTGVYRVQLTYRNGHCPQHADTLTRLLPLVRLKDIRYRDVLTVPDHPTELRARDTGIRFLWVPAAGLSDGRLRNPLATLKETATYLVRITMASGCVVFDTVEVKVARQPGIHVPKAFTPNGDGRNDRLRPILVGIAELRHFRVYNRWGNLLHESRGSASELGWDGVYRGVPQPMDTYVWTAVATDVRGNPLQAGGNTLLMR